MHSFATPLPVTVEIRNASGEIDVTLTDSEETTVDVTLVAGGALGVVDEIVRAFGGRRNDADEPRRSRESRWWEQPTDTEAGEILDRVRVELRDRDDTRTVIVDTDPASRGWRTSFAVRVNAPSGSGVRVVSQSADTAVTGTASLLDIRTASGDVAAGQTTGGVRVRTASGDIRLASVGGPLSSRTASGDLTVGHVAQAATLHTTSGRVQVDSAGDAVEVRTVSGDVRIADLLRGDTTVTAVSGDVELGVHAGVLAAVNLATVSGDTRSDLAVTDEPGQMPDAEDAAVAGPEHHDPDASADGGVASHSAPDLLRIQVRTTSGDIRLRRSASAPAR